MAYQYTPDRMDNIQKTKTNNTKCLQKWESNRNFHTLAVEMLSDISSFENLWHYLIKLDIYMWPRKPLLSVYQLQLEHMDIKKLV